MFCKSAFIQTSNINFSPSEDNRGTQALTFTLSTSLETQINIKKCLWTVGENRRKPTLTQGEHANSAEKDPQAQN